MASTATLGYSAPIMAAQPVDTDTTAAPLASAPDIMSSGLGRVAAQETETQYMDMADESLDSMGLSEDSPAPPERQPECAAKSVVHAPAARRVGTRLSKNEPSYVSSHSSATPNPRAAPGLFPGRATSVMSRAGGFSLGRTRLGKATPLSKLKNRCCLRLGSVDDLTQET